MKPMTPEEREFFTFWLIHNGGTVFDKAVTDMYSSVEYSKIRSWQDMIKMGWGHSVSGRRSDMVMTNKAIKELQNVE
jgi:hypothetical protein